MAIQVNEEGLKKLSTTVMQYWKIATDDRKPLEKQMIKNLRQYLGKYDPEMEKLIPIDRSKAYPRDTRMKVKNAVAKLMEMMFPSQERNWTLETSTIPSIPKADLQAVIDALTQQELEQAIAEQREPRPLRNEEIERGVLVYADQRREAMEEEIADQLEDKETDYPNMCKRVVRSGLIYGWGVARSPMVRKQEERVWELNEDTGEYEAKRKTVTRPYPEYVRVWDIFPDLSTNNWFQQDRIFERMVMNRHDVRMLSKRDDFIKSEIKQFLIDHQDGNYHEREFEADLKNITNTSNLANKKMRKYEIIRMLGYISAHELAAAGVEIDEDDMHGDILADIWMLGNRVIKAEVASFGERPSDHYPAFIASEDEDAGLTGVGMPEDLRDSQMALCASSRAMYDNMAAVAGPIFEVNEDLLPHGRKQIGSIRSFMTIAREGAGNEANVPAIRQLNTNAHISEIQSIVTMTRQQLDSESGIPAWQMGDIQQPLGEAFRTSTNMSMMMSGANMFSKDIVRSFDQFTSQVIGGLLAWNMEFNDKEDIKGDFNVRAKGAHSLAAKEVRGAAIDQFIMTLDEREKLRFDMHAIGEERLKARDLPVRFIKPREIAEADIARYDQARQQAAQIEQGLTIAKTQKEQAAAQKASTDAQVAAATAPATVQEILSRVRQNLANASTAEDRAALERLEVMLEQVAGEPQAQQQ